VHTTLQAVSQRPGTALFEAVMAASAPLAKRTMPTLVSSTV